MVSYGEKLWIMGDITYIFNLFGHRFLLGVLNLIVNSYILYKMTEFSSIAIYNIKMTEFSGMQFNQVYLTILQVLNLEAMDKTRHWKIVGCSAYTGEGLLEGFDWLVQDIASRIYMLD